MSIRCSAFGVCPSSLYKKMTCHLIGQKITAYSFFIQLLSVLGFILNFVLYVSLCCDVCRSYSKSDLLLDKSENFSIYTYYPAFSCKSSLLALAVLLILFLSVFLQFLCTLHGFICVSFTLYLW